MNLNDFDVHVLFEKNLNDKMKYEHDQIKSNDIDV